jgi:hypothetical protein
MNLFSTFLLCAIMVAGQTQVSIEQATKSHLFWWGSWDRRFPNWTHVAKNQVRLPQFVISTDGTSIHVAGCVITPATPDQPIWLYWREGNLEFTFWPGSTVTGCNPPSEDLSHMLFMFQGTIWTGSVTGGYCTSDPANPKSESTCQ